MQLNKPFYVKSTDGHYALYNPRFALDKSSPGALVPASPELIGQYKTEEEVQIKSMKLFGEKAILRD